MPKAFTEHEKDLISKRLIEQGYKLFSVYGLKKTSIEELAQAAGISKGAFYLFYESKEALFMDVAELAEQHFRQDILATVDLPGPSPRARMFAILKKGFSLLKTIPILQFLTGSDYDLIFRRTPPEKFQEHLANDRVFLDELIAHCRKAGIPIQAKPDDIITLLYPLILSTLHEDDYGAFRLGGGVDVFLELVAAFCLGEVKLQNQQPNKTMPSQMKETEHEPGD
ncbi:MAG TPA: TetR/AcrR family transcriptional regulator [Ktedonobacteraceae bacterium]|jgi:AcrR family transcriptional regulator|nr:TetR/AcrR family transcriptional regulator [Ktedonobacteraceae bacterium]